jgi:hypothetical protein
VFRLSSLSSSLSTISSPVLVPNALYVQNHDSTKVLNYYTCMYNSRLYEYISRLYDLYKYFLRMYYTLYYNVYTYSYTLSIHIGHEIWVLWLVSHNVPCLFLTFSWLLLYLLWWLTIGILNKVLVFVMY